MTVKRRHRLGSIPLATVLGAAVLGSAPLLSPALTARLDNLTSVHACLRR